MALEEDTINECKLIVNPIIKVYSVNPMKKSFFLQFVAMLFFSINIFSQNPNNSFEAAKMRWHAKQIVPPSPDAAELGKYGNVPVSLYTGTPKIDIPFFELKGDFITVAVSLSYSATGFKPSEMASWVGSGWVLNAGGVITRTVKGNPDDDVNYYNVPGLLDPPNELAVIPYYNYVKDIQEVRKETQPDIYYYNFNGYSGKFIIRPDKTIAKSKKDLHKIVFGEDGFFSITDEKGVKYVFDQIEETTLLPQAVEGQPNYSFNYTSSWYLSKIISPNGHEIIEFEYHSSTIPQSGYENLQENKTENYTYGVKYTGAVGCPEVRKYQQNTSYIAQPPLTTITRKYLKRVSFTRNNVVISFVDFVSSQGERLDSDYLEDRHLTQLQLFSRDGAVDKQIKGFMLKYGYFSNDNNAITKKRLRLDSIQGFGGNIIDKMPPYVFSYNNDFILPERFTKAVDHWGFYNEAVNLSLVPNYAFPEEYVGTEYGLGMVFQGQNMGNGANREASFSGSAAAVLTKIQYPTGGYSAFSYELNTAKVNNDVKDIGGIRIKQIIDFSSDNEKALIKNYTYQLPDGTTSGQVGIWPIYHSKSQFNHLGVPTQIGEFTTCEQLEESHNYDLYTIAVSANAIFGLGSFQGSHIGYSQVTESMLDFRSNQPLGKTVYKYFIGPYMEHNDDARNGSLIEKVVYDNQNRVVEQDLMKYTWTWNFDIVAKVPKAKDYQTDRYNYCKVDSLQYEGYADWQTLPNYCTEVLRIPTRYYLETYSFMVQDLQLEEETKKSYDVVTDSSIAITKNMTYYTESRQLASISTKGSDDSTTITAFTYPLNYTGTTVYDTMISKNMVAPVIQTSISKNGVVISGQKNNYGFFNGGSLISESGVSRYNRVSAQYEPEYEINQYSASGKVQEYQKVNDLKESFIWGYHDSYPIAQITNAPYASVSYTSFEPDSKGNWVYTYEGNIVEEGVTGYKSFQLSSGNGIQRTGLNTATDYIISYWLKNGSGAVSLGGTALLTKGDWTLYQVQLSGVSDITITGTGVIDELRLYPKMAQMTTYTHAPLIGITSQCDPNNRITYYEYDAMGRLKLIRDQDRNILKSFEYKYANQ